MSTPLAVRKPQPKAATIRVAASMAGARPRDMRALSLRHHGAWGGASGAASGVASGEDGGAAASSGLSSLGVIGFPPAWL